MTKFAKVLNRAEFLEAAAKQVMEVAYAKVRYDDEYLSYEDTEETDHYNDEWLEAHLTPAGRELIDLARSVAAEIENIL